MTPSAAQTTILDARTDPRWAALVARSADASIFHHPAWLRVLTEQYPYRLGAFCVVGRNERVAAGIPVALVSSRLTGRRLVALPFSDACPPLLGEDAPSHALHALAAALESERRRRAVAIEVRCALPELSQPSALFLRHLLDLRAPLDDVEARYAPQVRRNIRKARRAGVVVERRVDVSAIDTFYELHLKTRRRLGVPTQSRGFIRSLESLFAQGLGFTAIAYFQHRPVAAAVFLTTGRTLTYKYGASDQRFQHVRPNNILFAEIIRWATETGLDTLDFGRTDPANEGLRAFKRSWGASEEPLAYTYSGNPPARGGGRLGAISAAVIRNTPEAVGRVAGTLLYPHAG